ncbi:hypothetical protein HK104_011479 [Borealophlyctis nickersoniae]|nr:hypothetical protein HK104_011479 [Borealophlyctis nickersoniae]
MKFSTCTALLVLAIAVPSIAAPVPSFLSWLGLGSSGTSSGADTACVVPLPPSTRITQNIQSLTLPTLSCAVIDAGLPKPANLNPIPVGDSSCFNAPLDQNLVNTLTSDLSVLGLDQCKIGAVGASIFLGKGTIEFFEGKECTGNVLQTDEVNTGSVTVAVSDKAQSIRYTCDEAGSLEGL